MSCFLVGCFWLHPQIPGDWTCDHALVCHVGKVRTVMAVGRWAGMQQQSVNGGVARVRAAATPPPPGRNGTCLDH